MDRWDDPEHWFISLTVEMRELVLSTGHVTVVRVGVKRARNALCSSREDTV